MEYDFCDNTTVMSRHGTSYHFSIYDYFSGFSLENPDGKTIYKAGVERLQFIRPYNLCLRMKDIIFKQLLYYETIDFISRNRFQHGNHLMQ